MKIKVITLFPELIASYLQDALLAKAIAAGRMSVETISLRDFTEGRYKAADDEPFGGSDGMLIKPDVLERALLHVRNPSLKQKVIYFTPQGRVLDQPYVEAVVQSPPDEIILICGRYAGVDQRFINAYVDEEVSIGNYVLSGGELPALVLVEALSRFIPGVLGKLRSAHEDSFKNNLLEAPQFTRPQSWNGQSVPEVLLSGHHQKIADWKETVSLLVTLSKRPDLLNEAQLTPAQQKKIAAFLAETDETGKTVLGLKK